MNYHLIFIYSVYVIDIVIAITGLSFASGVMFSMNRFCMSYPWN